MSEELRRQIDELSATLRKEKMDFIIVVQDAGHTNSVGISSRDEHHTLDMIEALMKHWRKVSHRASRAQKDLEAVVSAHKG